MDIFLYNSLSKKKEIFNSIEKNKVSIYVCGPTTYDHLHIGNIRPMVVFDILRRLLIYLKYDVTFVTNLTDIDDKIINKAFQENKSEKEISDFYIREIKKISDGINCLKPDFNPRVTDYINEIINFIEKLINNKNAYVDENGDILFDTKSVKNYGELSNINIDKLKNNSRKILIKKNNFDFILWKKTTTGIQWNSPWGKGRPGWHTECCVMINEIFKNKIIDIHGGGFDLKFPHHENEIAQNKALYNNKLANYWVHNGFVMFENNKMSKSLKNIVLAKDLIDRYGCNVVRLLMMKTHYRSPLLFSEKKIIALEKEMKKITDFYNRLAIFLQRNNVDPKKKIKVDINDFLCFLSDDLNISLSFSYLFDLMKSIDISIKKINLDECLNIFKKMEDIFYILGLKIDYHILTNDERKMINDFNDARKNKDFNKSDAIRKKLLEKGLL